MRPQHLAPPADLASRQDIARAAFAEIGDIPPSALRVLAEGLELTAQGSLRELAQPLSYQATALEHEDSGDLAILSMARALRVIAGHPDCPELIERLEGMQRAPWAQIREAVVAVQRREGVEKP